MSGSTSKVLRNLRRLKIQRCGRLLSDFVERTRNAVLLQPQPGAGYLSLSYVTPDTAVEISVGDLSCRIPDPGEEYSILNGMLQYTSASVLFFNNEDGGRVRVDKIDFTELSDYFTSQGYKTSSLDGEWCGLSCDAEMALRRLPLFIYTYLVKPLGFLIAERLRQ